MEKSYVGITGFMNLEEVNRILGTIDYEFFLDRQLMVGVLASLKTLGGQQNKWPNRYPKMEDISRIFTMNPDASDPDTLNLIHYSTKEPETLLGQLSELTRYGGPNLNGFQLNIAWPAAKTLLAYRLLHPGKVIVLQVGNRAFEDIGHNPERLAKRIQNEYSELIDYILLDPSGGLGRPLDTERVREYLQALKEKNLGIGLVVAGGLSHATLGLIEPLAKDFPDLSIDAEGLLRNKDDTLNVDFAREYVWRAWQILKRAE